MKEIKKPATDRVKTGLFTLLILLLSCISVFSQNVGINATGAVPNAAAGLDVDFPNKGVLIPRVVLTGTASFAPLTAHVAGMVVYNTATAGDVIPGLYYNDGTKWIPGKMAGTAAGNMLYWNGSAWASIPAGSAGQYLTLNESGIPTWTYATVAGNYATLTTTNVSAITATTATTGGNVTNDGGMPVLTRGVCYGTSPNPTTSNSVSTASPATGVGTYTNNLTGLLTGTTYYVRAFATNSTVTSYGNEISFTTLASAPTVTTTAATAVTASTATSGGNVTANGGAGITERGIVYSTSVNPTIITGTKVIDGTPGTGIFISNISGLSGGTLYHVRAYATNSINTSYGSDLTFTTTVAPPTLQTTAVTNVSGASVTSGGSMTWNGGGYSNYQYYGICYSTVPNSASPTYVNTNSSNYPVNPAVNIAPWVTNITGLAANTTYYIRSFLYVYKSGWSYVYGNEVSFTTSAPSSPIVGTTTAINAITASTATSGGTITTDGGSAITAKGVCWDTNPNPTLGVNNFTNMGAGTGAFGSNITGLTGNTTYYVRSYATNGVGTSYGPEQSFKTCATPAYNIGDQVGGGIVFYVNCDGSGLIASTEDQSASVIWGCSGVNIGTSANLGTGAANTAAILNGCATRPIAASVASSYNGGGFTDWYLPSSQELYQMMQKNAMLNMYGQYWTSSDGTSTTTAAMYYYINNLQFSSAMKNTSLLKVRAIRSFSAPTLPSVTTDVVSNVAGTSATCGGNVTNDGGAPILAAGVCWSTTSGPTIADSKTNDASVTGPFNSSLTGLTFPTTYYVRAYVTNGAGTSYGNEVSFTTITVNLATVTTDAITNLLGTSATTGGNVTADGGSTVTDRGVCWDITSNPDLNNLSGSGGKLSDAVGGLGTFISNITGLVTDQQYYVRAFAINDAGIAYGSDIPFTPTGNTIPTLTTVAVTSPTPTGGISGGAITSTGGEPITVSGICWSDVNYPPTIADNKTTDGILTTGNFASTLTGLVAGTQYNIRAYATNSLGTAYGDEVFYIPVDLPTLAISPLAYYIPDTYAQLPISVSNTGGGTLSAYGVVWGTTASPTVDFNEGITTEDINNYWITQNALISPLVADGSVTYYIRAYATSEAGTVYGTEIVLNPGGISLPTVSTDNVYNKIGSIAEVGGTILSDGGDPIISAGICWGTATDPDIVSNNIGITTNFGVGGNSTFITGLTIGTTYHVRVYATNSIGTVYGADLSFVATAATVGQIISSPYGYVSVVFSIDGTGSHGLMADSYPWMNSDWGCTSSVTGATGTAVGDGINNTNAIIADITTHGCSSAFAGDPNYSDFAANVTKLMGADWYLPSKDEVDLLGLTLPITVATWSSSEIDATHAWYYDGTSWQSGLKTAAYLTWAIRSF